MKECRTGTRGTNGSCIHDSKKIAWGPTYRSLLSKLGSDRLVSATGLEFGYHMVDGDPTYSHIAGRLMSSHFLEASVRGPDVS